MNLLYRFSGPITNKVIHSQVAGNLKALKETGLEVNLLAWCGAGHAMRNRAAYHQARADLERILGQPVNWRLTMDRIPRLDKLLKASELTARLREAAGSPLVLQTRSVDIGLLMASLRRQSGHVRFVHEMRGDPHAELGYLAGRDSPDLALRLERLDNSLRQIFSAADLVLCVSHVLADRLAGRYGLSRDLMHVQPCTADEQRFVLNPAARREKRALLGLRDADHLLVYSGSLSKGWDQPEAVLAFLAASLYEQPDLHALLLSPDGAVARRMIAELPSGRVHHRALSHLEIQDWLCAGDSALLLREAHALNEVASPTKAAEYMLCGLPLLLSAGVGDYSNWVEREGAGLVLQGNRVDGMQWAALRRLDREAVRTVALTHVSRQQHALAYRERLSSLFDTSAPFPSA